MMYLSDVLVMLWVMVIIFLFDLLFVSALAEVITHTALTEYCKRFLIIFSFCSGSLILWGFQGGEIFLTWGFGWG